MPMGLPGSVLEKKMGKGEDKLRELCSVDWRAQLEYAEKLGLGERKYATEGQVGRPRPGRDPSYQTSSRQTRVYITTSNHPSR